MKKNLLAIAMFFSAGLFAQQRQATNPAGPASAPSQVVVEPKTTNNNIPFNPDHYLSADHEITIIGAMGDVDDLLAQFTFAAAMSFGREAR